MIRPVASGRSGDHLADLLDDVRCESISLFDSRHAAPWRLAVPGREETCGYLIEEGAALLEAPGLRYELVAGDLALVLQGCAHTLSSHGPDGTSAVGHAIYRLDRARAAPLLQLLPPALVLRGENGAMSRWLRPLAALIVELRESPEAGGPAVLRRLAEAAIIRAAQEYLRHQAPSGPESRHPDFYRLAPVLRAMHRRPGARWSVASLAREAGMSRTIFAMRFAEVMGETPAHYLARLRMSAARELLGSPRLSLAEVAARSGYRTDVAFARAFRRHYGHSPGEFRRARQAH